MIQKTFSSRRAFTLVELLIVLGIIVILSSLALPNMVASRKSANEASAIASMRQIASAQETWRGRHGGEGYATLGNLGGAGLLDTLLSGGHKSGYTFTQPVDPTDLRYTVLATPGTHAGDRHFLLDESGVIRAAQGEPADATSSPIQ